MKEILLLWSCLSGTECSKVAQTYYYYSPELQNVVENVNKKVPKQIVVYVAPAYAAAVNKKIDFYVTKDVSFAVSEKNILISYNKNF